MSLRHVCSSVSGGVDQSFLQLGHSVDHREYLMAGWGLAKQEKLFQGCSWRGQGLGSDAGRGTALGDAFVLVLTELEVWSCQHHSVPASVLMMPF